MVEINRAAEVAKINAIWKRNMKIVLNCKTLKLTEQQYLLICLGEECNEVGQAISKWLRFGMEDVNFLHPDGKNNNQRLVAEINDFFGTLEKLVSVVSLSGICDREAIDAKIQKLDEMMEYSRKVGILEQK